MLWKGRVLWGMMVYDTLRAVDYLATRPDIAPPFFRVRYEAAEAAADPAADRSVSVRSLAFPATFTVWIPPGVERLRGIVVHQHGCGTGSSCSGLTGAHDLHWQALARKWDCALLGPVIGEPEKANCRMWCDPRNGSDQTYLRALADLAKQTGHPEVATAP